MKILFYCPYNQSVPYIESLMEQFVLQGHEVFLITNEERSGLHEKAEEVGVEILAFNKRYTFPGIKQLYRITSLISLCRKHHFEICYTHYQEANLIGVLTQFFTKTRWVPTRHHSNCAYIDNNIREKIADKMINWLCRICISPSEIVSDQMIRKEGMNADKVIRINYGYNFNTMGKIDEGNVVDIRKRFGENLILIEPARFIPEKRHVELLRIMKELEEHRLPVRLLLLGKGPLEEELRAKVETMNLQEVVIFEGFRTNVQDYFKAADMVVHLSLSEASNSAVKEAAMCGTPAIVCSGVGDFDMYIENEVSGFLINPVNPIPDALVYLKEILNNKYDLKAMGDALKRSVIRNFDISQVINEYRKVHEKLNINA